MENMSKTKKIMYWISTIWLALGMASAGIVQLIKLDEEVESILSLGYPEYVLTLLGIWKLLGVIVILIPNYPLLKEWAYAGFFFNLTGAIYSHIASDGIANILSTDVLAPLFLLSLTALSWYFRPVARKILSHKNHQDVNTL